MTYINGQANVPKNYSGGLSLKLLLLTIVFVMVSEILIYVPSIANFRNVWLSDRLEQAKIAVLTIQQDNQFIPLKSETKEQILAKIGVQAIILRQGNDQRQIIMSDKIDEITSNFYPNKVSAGRSIVEAFRTLYFGKNRVIRIIGSAIPLENGVELEIILNETLLRQDMLQYSVNILQLSLIISIFTATLVYLSLRRLFVRPFRKITHHILRFSEDPENAEHIMPITKRKDEVGIAQNQLAHMQSQLQTMLSEKHTLAELGLAVAKINHDLRNLLASAVLFSDRLGMIDDPIVQRFAPKLLRTLNRAIDYCQSTLAYGQAREAPPAIRMVQLHTLVTDVADVIGIDNQKNLIWKNRVPLNFTVNADPDQLFRVILNLCRNALEAMATNSDHGHIGRSVINELTISASYEENNALITIADTGPGVPEARKSELFKAFRSQSGPYGTGLGLAIASELVRAHNGTLTLDDVTQGASFTICLPYQPQKKIVDKTSALTFDASQQPKKDIKTMYNKLLHI